MAPFEKKVVAILGGERMLPRRGRIGVARVGLGDPAWAHLVREGLPSSTVRSVAEHLDVSVAELSADLGLPARTIHRRLEHGQRLTSEESERSLRVARALARAQELLGDRNGRAWLREPSRGLGGEVPVKMLDTADGFAAVMDELGRLEYGVIA